MTPESPKPTRAQFILQWTLGIGCMIGCLVASAFTDPEAHDLLDTIFQVGGMMSLVIATQAEFAIRNHKDVNATRPWRRFPWATCLAVILIVIPIRILILVPLKKTLTKQRYDQKQANPSKTESPRPADQPTTNLPPTNPPEDKGWTTKTPSPTELENLSRQIEIQDVQVLRPDDQNKFRQGEFRGTGTLLVVQWRNGSNRPIREVRALVTLTDENGNASPIAPQEVTLYAQQEPVKPGATQTDSVVLSNDIAPAGTKAELTILYATEGLVR